MLYNLGFKIINLYMSGETMRTNIEEINVNIVGKLDYGIGKIGVKLEEEQLPILEKAVRNSIEPVTAGCENTAICMDGRERVLLGDGSTEGLDQEVYYQVPGGLVKATTDAAVMTNAHIVRDAKDYREAYHTVREFLGVLGYQPSKHEGCLAMQKVADSFTHALDAQQTFNIISSITQTQQSDLSCIEENLLLGQTLVGAGFFDSWNPEEEREYVLKNFPHHHSKLYHDDSPTAGHNECALVIIDKPGYALNKNAFNKATGMQVFSFTPSILHEINSKIAVSSDEKRRLDIANLANLVWISNIIISREAELAVIK